MYEQFNKRPAAAVTVWREAESGGLTAPLVVRSDTKASGGRTVRVRSGANSIGSVPSKGRLRLSLSLPRAGSYRLWGRVIAPTNGDNSFWLRIDGGAWRVWDGIELGRSWHWVDVHTTGTSEQTLLLNLTAGSHVIDLAYREDGAQLDRLLLTNVPSYVPGGLGDKQEALIRLGLARLGCEAHGQPVDAAGVVLAPVALEATVTGWTGLPF